MIMNCRRYSISSVDRGNLRHQPEKSKILEFDIIQVIICSLFKFNSRTVFESITFKLNYHDIQK